MSAYEMGTKPVTDASGLGFKELGFRHPLWSSHLSWVCAQGPPSPTPAWAVLVLQRHHF